MNFILHKILSPQAQVDIQKEVSTRPNMFGRNPIRTGYGGSAHSEIKDILLRGPTNNGSIPTLPTIKLHKELQCSHYPAFDSFPVIEDLVDKLFMEMGFTQVGRVIITKLRPDAAIHPHVDEGPVPEYYQRFHYVIQDGGADHFLIGRDSQIMQTGQLWEVDVKRKHSCINMGYADRIHLIMDFH